MGEAAGHGQLIGEVLDDDDDPALGRANYDHRRAHQYDVRKKVAAHVNPEAPMKWREESHPTIPSAISATRPAAPETPKL